MRRGKTIPTLAAALDRTQWDYSPDTDSRILLASVERLFESVAWGIASRPFAANGVPGTAKIRVATAEDRPLLVLQSSICDR
jgi:hypothetical protein